MSPPCFDPDVCAGRKRWRLSRGSSFVDAPGTPDGENALKHLRRHSGPFRGWRLSYLDNADPSIPFGLLDGSKPVPNPGYGFTPPRPPTPMERFRRDHGPSGGPVYEDALEIIAARDSQILTLSESVSSLERDRDSLQSEVSLLETSVSDLSSLLSDLPYLLSQIPMDSAPRHIRLSLSFLLERLENHRA